MQVERKAFASFVKLLTILEIPKSECILNFENGKLLRYDNTLDFQFGLTNFYEEVLTSISNIRNREQFDAVADAFIAFTESLRVMMKRIFKGRQ